MTLSNKKNNRSSPETEPSSDGLLKNLKPKDLDILASEFNLTFDSKTGKFQTAIGGYLTLMVGVIFLGGFISTTVQYFRRDNPVVTASIEAGSPQNEFNMYHESLWAVAANPVGPVFLQAGIRERYVTNVWVCGGLLLQLNQPTL